MLWYSNGVIHQQAPLKHLDKPAEATPVAMVTSLKVDVCSQTVAAEILSVKTTPVEMDLFICLQCLLLCSSKFAKEVNYLVSGELADNFILCVYIHRNEFIAKLKLTLD